MKLLIFILVFSGWAFAQVNYKGNIKGKSKPCLLSIQQVYYVDNIEVPENLRADVVASLEDEHHQMFHGAEFFFTIRPATRPNLFSGVADNQ
jgi:hypothetical protein